jgi:hypothetical protein
VNPQIPGGKYRPNSPWRWSELADGMARHHVIPYPILRDVFNRLVDLHIYTDRPEARVTLRQYLSLCSRRLEHLDEKLDKMRFEDADRKRAGHFRLESLDTDEVNDLRTAAVWPAWNIVEGPHGDRRSDDPKDSEGDLVLDRFMVGLEPAERDRMRTVENLSPRLKTFLESTPDPDLSALHALSSDITLARRLSGNDLVGCERPIPFRPEMWVKESDGLWRKRRLDDSPSS